MLGGNACAPASELKRPLPGGKLAAAWACGFEVRELDHAAFAVMIGDPPTALVAG